MIKPLEPSPNSKGNFVVCDIENYESGEVMSIDTAWRNDAGITEHVIHRTWEEWCGWLVPRARKDKRFRTIFAHNGGGWDWLSLAHYFLTKGKYARQTVTAACAGSKMVTMTVAIEKKFSLHFCDSLQLLRSKLEDLGQKLCGRGKVDTGGLMPWDMQWDKMIEYQRGDTELLLEVLETALRLIRENIAQIDTFGYTVGSTAMKIFKTMGLETPITIPYCPIERAFYREGYAGGRVEVFRYGHFPAVNVYDINSLYPSIMLTHEVPISERVTESQIIEPDCVGVFRVRFEQRRKDIPAVLTQGGRGLYSGEGVYFTPELHLLKEVDSAATIEVQRGYIFVDTAKVFQDYVNKLYALRLSDPDGPLSLLCKYLLNSLYGKLGQKSEREQIVCVNSFEEIEPFLQDEGESPMSTLDDENGVYKVTKDSACGFEHVGIAGIITSGARATLYRGLLAAGFDRILYCDTDSVHTTGTLPAKLVGKALGQFKLEFSGEGVYCGKKLYGLRKDDKVKIRAKGVSVGGNHGARLTFDDLLTIANGGSIECRFKQPSTATEVFGSKSPCVFRDRRRTIKLTGCSQH